MDYATSVLGIGFVIGAYVWFFTSLYYEEKEAKRERELRRQLEEMRNGKANLTLVG